MNILKSIGQWANRITRKSVEFLPTESVFFGFLRSGTGLALNEGNLSDGYRKNSLVLSCISRLALGAIAAPLRVYEDDAPVKGHEIRELIKKPNSDMGEAMFWIYVMTYLAIGGNCYIRKLRNEYGMVIGLRPYSRAIVTPILNYAGGSSWIVGYRYSGGGISEDLPLNDVIHLRWLAIDPQNPWMGYSPLLAAATHVGTDQEATDYINALLKNDAAPRTIFTFKESADILISKGEKKKLRKKLQERWGGGNRGGVEVLDSQVEVHRLSMNLQELAFDTLRDVDEARICAVFHVPPIVAGANVGMKYSTYSNYREAKAIFTEDTISSLWVLVGDQMERGLRNEFEGDWSLHFDTSRVPALQANRGDREKWALDSYNAGLRTKNESRALIGEQPVDGGDTFAEGGIGAVGIVPLRGDGQKKSFSPLQLVRKAISLKAAEKFYTEEEATAHFKAYDDVAEESTDSIAAGVIKAFGELEKELLKQIGKSQKSLALDDVLSFWDEDFFKDLLTKHSSDEVQVLIETMLQQSVANVGGDWDKVSSLFDDMMSDLLEQSTSKIMESDTTVKSEVQELLKSVRDLPTDEIKAAIRERFTQYSDSRARTIARTTATFATGAAQTTAWSELGFEYAWLSQRDSVVRKTHEKADGSKPNKNGYFKIGRDRMKHPGAGSIAEENVNCRCMLIPEQKKGAKSYFYFYIENKAVIRRAA